jgi:hypothetical protein
MRETIEHKTHHPPTALLSEMAGEGVTNFIEAQKVFFNLAQEQTKILTRAAKQRLGDRPAAHAVADTLQRSVDTFVDMQTEFLKAAGKQTDAWVEASKTGKPYKGGHLIEFAREGMENFVNAQKRFLDVIVDETEKATRRKHTEVKKIEKTELSELARQTAESFVDAEKKLFEIAGRQMNANVKVVGKTLELIKPFPFKWLAELTRKGVKGYVDAENRLMDVVLKHHNGDRHEAKPVHRAKRVARPPKRAAAAVA